MDRETRNIMHSKAPRIKEVTISPGKRDGENGEMRIYQGDLYIRTSGDWLKLMSGDKLITQEITKNIDVIVSAGVLTHGALSDVTANQHHNKQHSLTSAADHTGTLSIAMGGTGAGNSNAWLNSRITTNANGSLNYDATGATAVNHDSLTGFASNEHYTQANIIATGVLNSGSINTSFGNIDNGASSIACGSLDISDGNITAVGSIDLDSITSAGAAITIGGTPSIVITDGTTIAMTLGNDSGDDFLIDSTTFAVEGDTGRVGIGTAAPGNLFNVNGEMAWGGVHGTAFYTYSGMDSGGLFIETVDDDSDRAAIRLQTRVNGTGAYTSLKVDADAGQFVFTNGDLVITDDRTVSSSTFASGFTGSGWQIQDSSDTPQGSAASGVASATFDKLTVRGTMTVYEMLIQQIRATNGSLIVSSAAKVEDVDEYANGADNVGKITFESTVSGTKTCPFVVNDIIMCQRVHVNQSVAPGEAVGDGAVVAKKVYLVGAVTQNVVTTADASFTNDTAPVVGDDFVRLGNTGTAARQGVIYITADDDEAPFIDIKSGVNSYANWAIAPKVRLGKLNGITDADAGLPSGHADSADKYGLYSDSVYLKGHIHATSGQIGGWSMDANAVFYGTEVANNTFTAAGSITLGAGFLGANQFKIASDGTATFKGSITGGSLSIGSGDNILRVNTVGDLWIGDATEGDAPFQVTKAGAVTCTNLTVTNIKLSGTVTFTTPGQNVMIGGNNNDSSGGNCVSIGNEAGEANDGYRCIAVGHKALEVNASGDDNTCVGFSAGKLIARTSGETGTNNTCYGSYAGDDVVTGANSIYLGYKATSSGTAWDSEIVIGASQVGKGGNTATIKCSSGMYIDGSIKNTDTGYTLLSTAGNATSATTATRVTSEGVVEACKIKIFEGTTAAVNNNEEITHGITNGKKRIAMISVSVVCDEDPPGNIPVGALLSGGGSIQDEIDVDRQFQTYYDDSKIYIHTDLDADAMASNQYVCSVWYTATDIY